MLPHYVLMSNVCKAFIENNDVGTFVVTSYQELFFFFLLVHKHTDLFDADFLGEHFLKPFAH